MVHKKVVVGISLLTPGYVTPVQRRGLNHCTLAVG